MDDRSVGNDADRVLLVNIAGITAVNGVLMMPLLVEGRTLRSPALDVEWKFVKYTVTAKSRRRIR